MANKVLLKKSSVAAKVPLTTDLDYGEVALNYTDGKLYFKNASNVIKSFTIDDSVVTLTGTQTLTNKTLTSPTVTGTLSTELLSVTQSVGDEGGEILLAKPQTNTTLVGAGVTIDVYQNKLRIFEQGGTTRGVYIDLTAAGAGVATNLIAAGGGGSGTVTSITAGTGLTGGTITTSGTIAIDSTVATLTDTQTLTNKTLTSPTINSGALSGTFTGAPTFSDTTASTSSTTGSLKLGGGLGVAGNIYVGSASKVGFVNASNVSVVYQVYNAATNSLDTVFG